MLDYKRLITKKELADRLEISISSINKHLSKGLPFYRKGQRVVLFDFNECKKYFFKKEQ